MNNLPQLKSDLKQLLTKGIPEVINRLKELLPEGSTKAGDVLLIEGRFNDENKKCLRGVSSNEELQITYNKIRASLLDFIDGLKETDFSNQPSMATPKKGPKSGELLYRIPNEMELEKETKCVVRIALSDEEIIKNLELDEHVVLRSLNRVSNLMQVSLIDPNTETPFAIRTISEPEQIIFEDGYTEWLFFVKPLHEGTFPLVIKVAVIEMVFNKERKREIIFEEQIDVSTKVIPQEELVMDFKKSEEAFVFEAVYDDTPTEELVERASTTAPPKPSAPSASPAPAPTKSRSRIPAIAGMLMVLAVGIFGIFQLNNSGDINPTNPDAFAYAEATTSDQFAFQDEVITTKVGTIETRTIPAQFETKTEQVLAQAASTKLDFVPPQFRTETETILIENAREEYICTEPQFEEKTKRIVIKEEVINPGNLKIEYETVQEKIMVQPEAIKYVCTPPPHDVEQKIIKKRAAWVKRQSIPAIYKTIQDTIEKERSYFKYEKPTYKDVDEIIIQPATTQWVLEKQENCNAPAISDCMVLVEKTIPAVTEKIASAKILESCPEGFEFDGLRCVKEVIVPPKVITRREIETPASEKEIEIPAVFDTVEIKTYRGHCTYEPETVPAQYKTIERRLIKNKNEIPANKIKRTEKTITIKSLKSNGTYRLADMPARTTQVQRITMSRPPEYREIQVPPTYRTHTTKAIVSPEKVEVIDSTASVTKIIKKKVLVKKGGEKIQVQVLKNPSKKVIRQIQTVLSQQDIYKGTVDGKLNAATLTALSIYQNNNGLPIGQIDKDTLKKMGVI